MLFGANESIILRDMLLLVGAFKLSSNLRSKKKSQCQTLKEEWLLTFALNVLILKALRNKKVFNEAYTNHFYYVKYITDVELTPVAY